MSKKLDISNLIITSLNDVRKVNLQENSHYFSTTAYSTLVIRKSGNAIYKVNGKSFSSNSDSVIFIAKDTEYELTVESSGECIVIEFDIAESQKAEFFNGNSIFEYMTLGDKTIFKIAKNLRQVYGLRGPAYYSKCFSELYLLTTQISTTHAFNYSLAGKYGIIHNSVKFIEANYFRQDLYTPMLAELSGIGETYYRNIFLAVFNMPPAHYIQLYRVGKAKELLLNSDATMEEIAVAVGFANASYFCKVFKNLTNMTPSEFAQNSRSIG